MAVEVATTNEVAGHGVASVEVRDEAAVANLRLDPTAKCLSSRRWKMAVQSTGHRQQPLKTTAITVNILASIHPIIEYIRLVSCSTD